MNVSSLANGNDGKGRDFGLSADRDRARAFRGAARHSRHVRFLRVAIPVTVVLVLAGAWGAHYFNPLRLLSRLPADFGPLVISGTKITMQAPRMAGFTRDSRAYEVTARAAAQDLKQPGVIELKEILAKFDTPDQDKMSMTAAAGLYDTKADKMKLGPNIVFSTKDYEGFLSEASVDVRNGDLVSDKPVEVKMLKGTLNSNRLEVLEGGGLLRFGGGVSMVVTLESGDNPPAQQQPPPPSATTSPQSGTQ
jgi:lipopolysaccharide export system protein LptC